MLDKKMTKLLYNAHNKEGWFWDTKEDVITLKNKSPYGNNLNLDIEYDDDNQVDSFLDNLEDAANSFDVNKYVEDTARRNNENWCSVSIPDLVKEGEAIKDMCFDLYEMSSDYIKGLDKELERELTE